MKTQGKGSVLATHAVETQGKGSVLASKHSAGPMLIERRDGPAGCPVCAIALPYGAVPLS